MDVKSRRRSSSTHSEQAGTSYVPEPRRKLEFTWNLEFIQKSSFCVLEPRRKLENAWAWGWQYGPECLTLSPHKHPAPLCMHALCSMHMPLSMHALL
eukprot:109931-Chlamydomonas_euryale.AAC.1